MGRDGSVSPLVYGVNRSVVIIVNSHGGGGQHKTCDEAVQNAQPRNVKETWVCEHRADKHCEAHHCAVDWPHQPYESAYIAHDIQTLFAQD